MKSSNLENLMKEIAYKQARKLINSYSDGIESLLKSTNKEMKRIKVVEVDKYGVREAWVEGLYIMSGTESCSPIIVQHEATTYFNARLLTAITNTLYEEMSVDASKVTETVKKARKGIENELIKKIVENFISGNEKTVKHLLWISDGEEVDRYSRNPLRIGESHSHNPAGKVKWGEIARINEELVNMEEYEKILFTPTEMKIIKPTLKESNNYLEFIEKSKYRILSIIGRELGVNVPKMYFFPTPIIRLKEDKHYEEFVEGVCTNKLLREKIQGILNRSSGFDSLYSQTYTIVNGICDECNCSSRRVFDIRYNEGIVEFNCRKGLHTLYPNALGRRVVARGCGNKFSINLDLDLKSQNGYPTFHLDYSSYPSMGCIAFVWEEMNPKILDTRVAKNATEVCLLIKGEAPLVFSSRRTLAYKDRWQSASFFANWHKFTSNELINSLLGVKY